MPTEGKGTMAVGDWIEVCAGGEIGNSLTSQEEGGNETVYLDPPSGEINPFSNY